MSKECEWCGAEVTETSAYLLGKKLDEVVIGYNSFWGRMSQLEDGDQLSVNGFGVWTMIAKNTVFGEDQGNDNRQAFMILESSGILYRKNGTVDSYGDEADWRGPFKNAIKKIVEAVTYE